MALAAPTANADSPIDVTRSVTGRRWVFRQGDERAGLMLAQRLGLPEVVGRMLAAESVVVAKQSAEGIVGLAAGLLSRGDGAAMAYLQRACAEGLPHACLNSDDFQ